MRIWSGNRRNTQKTRIRTRYRQSLGKHYRSWWIYGSLTVWALNCWMPSSSKETYWFFSWVMESCSLIRALSKSRQSSRTKTLIKPLNSSCAAAEQFPTQKPRTRNRPDSFAPLLQHLTPPKFWTSTPVRKSKIVIHGLWSARWTLLTFNSSASTRRHLPTTCRTNTSTRSLSMPLITSLSTWHQRTFSSSSAGNSISWSRSLFLRISRNLFWC